jgi:mitochondrial fission protein ELM1
MATVWTLHRARRWRRQRVEAQARSIAGCWGHLSGNWNARDTEYVPGRSHLIHFTTIHTQPWRPFPERYVYQHNPVGQVLNDLERSADERGFAVFDLRHPSASYDAHLRHLRSERPGLAPASPRAVADLVRQSGAKRVLIVSMAGRGPSLALLNGSVEYESWDPLSARPTPSRDSYDLVACYGLELLPDEDSPWVLDDLAARTSDSLYLAVSDAVEIEQAVVARGSDWWTRRVESAAGRHPQLRWSLAYERGNAAPVLVEGGMRVGKVPTVWIVTNHKPGHTTQSVGLAQAMGLEYELKPIEFSVLSILTDRILQMPLSDPLTHRGAQLTPPWPDLLITTGWHTVPIARWIKQQSRGRTRIVQLGRKGGNVAADFDAVVTCGHFRLPPHPRRIETAAPLSQVTSERLDDARRRWPDLLDGKPAPRIVALVGGSTHQHHFDADTARNMGERLRRFAENAGGSVTVVTSRRTGDGATEALTKALGSVGRVHRWQVDAVENPYLGYLAAADVLVVTGDSESMLAEAAAAGKPLYIYPLPTKRRSVLERCADAVTRRAYSRPIKRRKGTVRPQQGLEYVCARLIERGWINPPRDLDTFYAGLYDLGRARPFGEELDREWMTGMRGPGLHEAQRAATELRRLLGWSDAAQAIAVTPADRGRQRAAV